MRVKPTVDMGVLLWLTSEQAWLAEMSWGLHEAIDGEDLDSVGSIAHEIARRMLTLTGELYWKKLEG